MLVQFSVENFRSFGEEVTLSMIASNRLSDHPDHCVTIPHTSEKLLRTAVIYGANAAGKSNLIKAMRFGQQAIVGGEQQFPTIHPFFGAAFANKPSTFEFRFLLDERIFIYGFDIGSEQIESEWLSVLRGEQEVDIFTRNAEGETTINAQAGKLFSDDQLMFGTLGKLKALPLTKRQLFLNRANGVPRQVQGKTLRAILQWLTKDLVILATDSRTRDILDRLQKDDLFRAFANTFLRSAGTGVAELEVAHSERPASDWERQIISQFSNANVMANQWLGRETEESDARIHPADPSKIITRTLLAGHQTGETKAYLPFVEESDGTKQLLHLMPVICPSLEHGKVVVIDELDRSLHPLICWQFIHFFSDMGRTPRRQMIVTTHEVHLLDQDLLRRDEYWFVEKDSSQQSRLVSLSDFKIRNDLQLGKGYLQGRFGAIPAIGGMDALERLLECGQQESGNAAQETTS